MRPSLWLTEQIQLVLGNNVLSATAGLSIFIVDPLEYRKGLFALSTDLQLGN